ncbi:MULTISPECIES: DUF3145 family protein [unclassified Leucobacter]|uniref:DUF3145 family protein n=1 Tax=unclassified Leucobacter TaxID=2621730 RepID=UPI001F12914C|nr:DUF3145 family protein [Leucobacter sp. CX169]
MIASDTASAEEFHTTGHLVVHSSARALARHIEWALARELGSAVSIEWHPQPLIPGSVRGEIAWSGPVGTGVRLASALHGWEQLRYEVTESSSPGVDGGRWMHTPSLGIAHLATDAGGSAVLTEHRIEAVLHESGGDPTRFAAALRLALATAWDEELELFRGVALGADHQADGGASVHWLHRVG